MYHKKKILIGVLVVVMIFGGYRGVTFATEIDHAKDQKTDLEKKKKATEAKIAELEKEKGNVVVYIEKLDKQLNELTGEIDELEINISKVEKDIEITKEELVIAKETENNQYVNMKKRIKYMYENGNSEYLEILFEASDIADFLNRTEYINQIMEYDNNLLDRYQEVKNSVIEKENKLEADLSELKLLEEELIFEQDTVKQLVNDKTNELAKYKKNIKTSQTAVNEYQKEIDDQEALIEDLLEKERQRIEAEQKAIEEAERKAKEEAERKEAAEEARQKAEEARQKAEEERQKAEEARQKEEEAKNKNDEIKSEKNQAEDKKAETEQNQAEPEQDQTETEDKKTETEQNQTETEDKKTETEQNQTETEQNQTETEDNEVENNPPEENKSENGSVSFRWPLPVSGKITSNFGGRQSPTAGASSNHKGIDIGVPLGTSVMAAAGGSVVTSSYQAAAGNYIMIYHGNSTYTVYMHCSKLSVSVGDQVEKGQVIAYSGSTGVSTGPHLHFGVSINGSYVNPLNYVSN